VRNSTQKSFPYYLQHAHPLLLRTVPSAQLTSMLSRYISTTLPVHLYLRQSRSTRTFGEKHVYFRDNSGTNSDIAGIFQGYFRDKKYFGGLCTQLTWAILVRTAENGVWSPQYSGTSCLGQVQNLSTQHENHIGPGCPLWWNKCRSHTNSAPVKTSVATTGKPMVTSLPPDPSLILLNG